MLNVLVLVLDATLRATLPIDGISFPWSAAQDGSLATYYTRVEGVVRVDWFAPPTKDQNQQAAAIIAAYDPLAATKADATAAHVARANAAVAASLWCLADPSFPAWAKDVQAAVSAAAKQVAAAKDAKEAGAVVLTLPALPTDAGA